MSKVSMYVLYSLLSRLRSATSRCHGGIIQMLSAWANIAQESLAERLGFVPAPSLE